MPAPFGTEHTAGSDEAGRFVRVLNTEETAIPPFAALEVFGYDKVEHTFFVRQPTVTGRNDCLFNTRTPIGAGKTGQALTSANEVAALFAPDGTTPEPGEIWGTMAGQWWLSPQSTGFVVRFIASENRNALVVARAPSVLNEWVRITGPTPGGDVPSTYYPGVVMRLNVADDVYEDTAVVCWWRDVWGATPAISERIHSSHVGNGGPADDYRPLYDGRIEESIVPTTTTGGPCLGTCEWIWNISARAWVLESHACCTAPTTTTTTPSGTTTTSGTPTTTTTTTTPGNCGCKCVAPTFCPSPPLDDNPARITTYCRQAPAHQSPPNCSLTTTTTTTPSLCVCTGTGCTYYCKPGFGWKRMENDCGYPCQPCDWPATNCTVANYCATVVVACATAPPPTPCTGSCRWIWSPGSVEGGEWVREGLTCSGGLGGCSCTCDIPPLPADAGSLECAAQTSTPCYNHCNTTRGPCDPPEGTTTTPGPGDCSGDCLFYANGLLWSKVSGCHGCGCAEPLVPPSGPGRYITSPCVATTTTTTTTTTTAGPTTTTPSTVHNCYADVNTGCTDAELRQCLVPAVGNADPDLQFCSGPYATLAECEAAGACYPTTTTPGGPTTTTTVGPTMYYCLVIYSGPENPCGAFSGACYSDGGRGMPPVLGVAYTVCSGPHATLPDCNAACVTPTTTTGGPGLVCTGGCFYTCVGGVWQFSSETCIEACGCAGLPIEGGPCVVPSGAVAGCRPTTTTAGDGA